MFKLDSVCHTHTHTLSHHLQAESDVVGCVVVDDGSSVSVVDTWNPAGNHTPNVMDSSQDGICVHKTSFMDGRVVCV